jgi:hypothetical protein
MTSHLTGGTRLGPYEIVSPLGAGASVRASEGGCDLRRGVTEPPRGVTA